MTAVGAARTPVSASAWLPVVAYATVSAANQILWLTFTPVTTDAAHQYPVSSGAIGWLAEIFPLLYVVLAVPGSQAPTCAPPIEPPGSPCRRPASSPGC